MQSESVTEEASPIRRRDRLTEEAIASSQRRPALHLGQMGLGLGLGLGFDGFLGLSWILAQNLGFWA